MSSLSTLFGGGGADPLLEGLPTVAVYGGDFNTNFDIRIHRVHSGELVGSPFSAITNSTAAYSHGQSNMIMFGYNSDYGGLNNSLSSQSYSSYGVFTQSIYQNDHYPYSFFGSCSPDGRMGFNSFLSTDFYQKLYRRINIQSVKGKRPRRQFNVDNYIFSETHFNSSYGMKSRVDLSTYINTTGHVNSNYGTCTYKQDTKQLVLYYPTSGSATTGYFHLIQGTVDLMEVVAVKDFFDTATYKRFYGNSDVTATGFNNINYNVQLILGDNNSLGVDISYNTNHYYRVFDLDVADGSNVAFYSSGSISNTTSYGPDQGMQYRGRYQQTWDSDWGCTYRPYYYYGGGLSAFFMSIANPAKWYKVNITTTSNGGALIPSGKTGFVWLHGENTDSFPIRMWGVDFDNVLSPGDAAVAENIGQANNIYSASLTSISSGGTFNSSYGDYAFQYPGYYYSTSYPRFMTVNWWTQEGAYQSA